MATVVSERIEITGTVQGVGFRPFVHRLATQLGLTGHVGNDSTKVFVEATGLAAAMDEFVGRIRTEAPRLASIETITRVATPVDQVDDFSIVESQHGEGLKTLVPPDTAVCEDCLRELSNTQDRRFGHPFITCTNCGPRFTIITAVPYDRPNTTMADFTMCSVCRAEYEDPDDRRFHAQPIACHDCGPLLKLTGAAHIQSDPIAETAKLILDGAVVAIKGLGGYHLACDAANDASLEALRSRKHRADKPFAVMVADLAAAQRVAHVTAAEAELLASPAAPIVLLQAKPDSPLSPLVAPGNPLIGVMLPYTPVHHLLMGELRRPVVMTSANRGGEPIAFSEQDIEQLDDLYDARLGHDRPIQVPCDDSVVRIVAGRLMPIRRSRGYAPIPVAMPTALNSVIAAGGELKNTFCLSTGNHAWVSQHIGDMENLPTLNAFRASVEQFSRMYDVSPDVVAADAHPAYLSSKWARTRDDKTLLEVQHHHAHIAAIMAEHQLAPAQHVLGFAFDGTGFGPDGAIWGGEVLVANAFGFDRVAHLRPIPLPGGDAAIRNPNRVALAHLHAARIDWEPGLAPLEALDVGERALLRRQLERSIACVPTTSMGRLFDAVASLIALRHKITYEAQAAIELEIAAQRSTDRTGGYRFSIHGAEIDPTPVLTAIISDHASDVAVETIAWRFHDAVASAVADLAEQFCARYGLDHVALSGGVFQNALLTSMCIQQLEVSSLRPLTHHLVPPNDGGLSLGQAYIAAHHPDQTKEV